ncbi:MAG: IS200/IS605 family transposase [Ginsengibacter sp.]
MANTYSQITIHSVFAVKGRENFITKNWRDELHQYISGIITKKGAKSFAVGGWKDHVHILFGMPVTICIADFMSAVKASSSGCPPDRTGRDKWTAFPKREISVAGRLWGFFLCQKPKRYCNKIHHESGRTSSQ